MTDIVDRVHDWRVELETDDRLHILLQDVADEIEYLRLESAGSDQLVKAGETIDRQAKEIERLKALLAEGYENGYFDYEMPIAQDWIVRMIEAIRNQDND